MYLKQQKHTQPLYDAEILRKKVMEEIDVVKQADLGQYFTPTQVAKLMAAFPDLPSSGHFSILDPGAGSGMLTSAIIERVISEKPDLSLHVTVVENDPTTLSSLSEAVNNWKKLGVEVDLIKTDFIEWGTSTENKFDLVIQNPPYKKLKRNSDHDIILREHEINVPNIYCAFLALGVGLLNKGGQSVSITPRSWMNGTYYREFRSKITKTISINAIHTYVSRSKVFGDMDVLQESVIVYGSRRPNSAYIKISKSQDIFSPIFSRSVKRDLVITTDYIFIPASKQEEDVIRRMNSLPHDLKSIGLNVSTGKVVDFRIRDFLCSSPSQNTYPMIYPSNISESIVVHPLERCKKPQWFLGDPEAAKLLVPPGSYVVVKRFSAKEERKRIVAAVWKSSSESAIDNKLNYFHFNGLPLSSKTALGLTKWLNSKFVDSYFRIFSGHTQVNATDLRKMKYPSLEELHELADKDDGWVDDGYFD